MLPAGATKWLKVDIRLARLVGVIRDPLAVRGERSLPLDELSVYHWKRFAVPKERKGPDVRCRWKRPAEGVTQTPSATSRSAQLYTVADHMAVTVSASTSKSVSFSPVL